MNWHTKKRIAPVDDVTQRVEDSSATGRAAQKHSAKAEYQAVIATAGALGDYDTVKALLAVSEH